MITNPVATWLQTVWANLTATAYKNAINGNTAVAQRFVDNFAPHQQLVANMTITLNPGSIWNGTTLTEVAAQSTGNFTAPVSQSAHQPRGDQQCEWCDSGHSWHRERNPISASHHRRELPGCANTAPN